MKSVLLAFIVATALIVPSRADDDCKYGSTICEGETCCEMFGPIGYCRRLLKKGETCELTPTMSEEKKHMYVMKCPCGKGLSCKADKSGSLYWGKCVANA